MKLKSLNQLNIIAQCRKYGLPFWECPHFIFLLMGIIIIISSVTTYGIGLKYIEDPLTISLIVLVLAGILFILAFIVTQSFERLAEASRLKLEFLTVISHQMRAPFSNLRWVIELLMSGKVGEIAKKHEEYLNILKENSERIEELIDKLITVSKIEQKMVPLKKEVFSLKNLTKKVILEFGAFTKASNVKIRFKAKEDLPGLLGDPSQIREAIENLLDNAIKYTKGKGQIEILLLEKKGKIYFEVKDNGVGIPKEDQKYIFQKFFRAKNILKKQTIGTGLGLFIAKSAIESHRGKIGFKSQEGKGTTFWFTLPIT